MSGLNVDRPPWMLLICHRPRSNAPSVFCADGQTGRTKYNKHGCCHRCGADVPITPLARQVLAFKRDEYRARREVN